MNNIIYNGNNNFAKSKKLFKSDINFNINKKDNNTLKIQKINTSSNILNNIITEKLYLNEKNNSINEINTKNDHIDIDDINSINEKKDIQNIKEVPNYNTRQINKSKSYFIEKNSINNKNKNNYITLNNTINSIKANYKKNINSFNHKNRILNMYTGNKNNKSLRHKIYYGLEKNNVYSGNESSENNSNDSINIDDLINKVNYTGEKRDFGKYMEELKLKAEITSLVQNMFKNEMNCYDGLDKFLDSYYKGKNKKILDMYKYMLDRLIQVNQNKINDDEINSMYNEIFDSINRNNKKNL